VTDARRAGIVVDTMVISWLIEPDRSPLADPYRELIGGRSTLVVFQTVMELRFGALNARWGELRRRRLESNLARLTLIEADNEMASVCASVRHRCVRVGHALGDKVHDGDRWIASAAIRLGVPLVSHDSVFARTPGLELLTLEPAS
jgi:predicted nucleic acid-binding protein